MGGTVAKYAFLPPHPFEIENKALLKFINTSRGHQIPVYHIQREKKSDFTILFSHGNAEDVGASEYWLHEMSKDLNVDVVCYDYPGYGFSSVGDAKGFFGSTAKNIAPSEIYCYEAISAVYKHLVENMKIPTNEIIVSLGTGPTVDFASKNNVRAVILQSPLLSAVRVVVKTYFTLPIDIFASVDKIHKIKAPVLIIHGTEDEVINCMHGKELYKLIQSPFAYEPLWIKGAHHNDIESGYRKQFVSKLREFLDSLRASGGISKVPKSAF